MPPRSVPKEKGGGGTATEGGLRVSISLLAAALA
jgi:hypothetical protein